MDAFATRVVHVAEHANVIGLTAASIARWYERYSPAIGDYAGREIVEKSGNPRTPFPLLPCVTRRGFAVGVISEGEVFS